MWIWQKFIKPAIEWTGRFQIVQNAIHTEFFRTTFMPVVWTMLTAVGGYSQHVPVMWIMMASAVVFMAVTMALVAYEGLKTLKTPENKLRLETVFQCDLLPADRPVIGNRHQRRGSARLPSQILSSTQIDANVSRQLEKAQLGVQVTNTATFPISIFLTSAETQVAGEDPPRSTFPKTPALVPAGGVIRVLDDRIDMDGIPCARLSGKMDLRLKYGLPGKEKFDLRHRGTVEIIMEHSGFVSQLLTSPQFD